MAGPAAVAAPKTVAAPTLGGRTMRRDGELGLPRLNELLRELLRDPNAARSSAETSRDGAFGTSGGGAGCSWPVVVHAIWSLSRIVHASRKESDMVVAVNVHPRRVVGSKL